jgi:hypothetical protein
MLKEQERKKARKYSDFSLARTGGARAAKAGTSLGARRACFSGGGLTAAGR